MSACRVARRVALSAEGQNPCAQAGKTKTLARKVFHYPCRLFSPWRGRRAAADAERSVVFGLPVSGRQWGVRLGLRQGGACRVAWQGRLVTTPFSTTTLVTKEKKEGIE
jgi:hypothetical protein